MRVARLTRNDYSAADWGDIELCASWASYRTFWAAVLSFAAADNADAVYYRESADDKCLGVKVGDDGYLMEPPPKEYRRDLLTAVKRLAGGGVVGVLYHQVVGVLTRSTYRGHVVVETPQGDAHWQVHTFPNGVRLQRMHNAA
jgi:hypothetical protein